METLMVVGSIWLTCALCAVLFIRGASSRAPALRRIPVASQEMRRATLRRDVLRDY